MIKFTVAKPLEVPLDKDGQVDMVLVRRSFWRNQLNKAAGCYVYAVPRKYGTEGLVPIYVGKSARPFSDECFNTEKLYKIEKYLRHHPSTKLFLFLIVHPFTRGVPNGQAIIELEAQLIRLAYKVNPRLINKQKAHADKWTVRGLLTDEKRRSRDAVQLRALLGLDADETVIAPAVPEPVTVETGFKLPVTESAALPSTNAAAP